MSGPDAPRFLQGVITQSILAADGRPRDSGFYTAFLNATGRVLHDVFIYPDSLGLGPGDSSSSASQLPAAAATRPGESFLIEVDASEAARLEKHIRRYKLRAKFAVRLLAAGEATVWHGWDDDGRAALDAASAGIEDNLRLQVADARAPGLGYRMVRCGDRPPLVDLEVGTEDAYRVRRYLHGVPEGQDELVREHVLPLDSNMDFMGGIDFRKGCYVGQELTIRTKHRGVVRKRILPCVVYEPERAMPEQLAYRPESGDGDSVGTPMDAAMIPMDTSIGRFEKRGRSAGKWLKGVGNVGLALCRLEIMTDVVLPGETAAGSYDPGDEFIMEQQLDDGQGLSVKVKAFVPEWLRRGLDESQHK